MVALAVYFKAGHCKVSGGECHETDCSWIIKRR